MYTIGDKIVYPMHGAGTITKIEEKEIFNEKQLFYLMEIKSEQMQILIPVSKADEIGVRSVKSESILMEGLKILTQDIDTMDSNWNKRYQANMNILKTGEFDGIATVLKNLTLLDRQKSLSSGEKKMLNTSKKFLASEIVLVMGKTKDEAYSFIDTYLI